MSEQLTFIPALEAAKFAGVTKETIRNLCKAGTLRYQMRGNMFYPCKEDVEQYTVIISEVHDIERSIEDYKKEIETRKKELEVASTELQEQMDAMNMFPERIKYILELLSAAFSYFDERLEPRELKIIELMLQGKALSEVGEKVSLSRERTRQVLEKALRKIQSYPNEVQIKDKIIQEQEQIIQEFQKKLSELGVSPPPYGQQFLLQTHLQDLPFSVRTQNCLRVAEIETVGDLVKMQRESLLRFRNFGKKGLEELDEFLAAHNLSWGMQID